ncbi:MAG: hypothetical protein Q7U58_05415 [Hydrogenophaga sp.]|nr:hypothetical protein [Hydrogenophaga sp.]
MWLRSHPDTAERLALLQAAAAAQGAQLTGATTPLPQALRALPAAAKP